MSGGEARRALARLEVLPKPALQAQAVVLLAQSAQDVFQRCVDLALSITRASSALITLYRPEEDLLELVAAAGRHREQAIGRRLPRGQGLAWRVVDSGEVLLLERADQYPDAVYVSGQRHAAMYLGVPLLDPDGQVLGVLSADTTDSPERLGPDDAQAMLLLGQAAGVAYTRWRALEHAQRSARQFERLAQLSAELAGQTQPEAIVRCALRALLELSGFTTAGVVTADERGLAQLTVLEGEADAQALVARALSAPHVPSGMIELVLRSGQPQVIADYQRWPGRRPDVLHVRSAVGVPLRRGRRTAGVVFLLNMHQPVEIPRDLQALLETVSARIEQALDRSASLQHLEQTREAALRALGRVLESRDGETFGHTDRVTTLALRLGRALHLDRTQLQHLRWGAYLHDLGKVGVHDHLLRKPGPLTPEERRAIERHVVLGDQMLRDEAFVPREVREVVRSHHERWDGAGYPDGLAGEAIPLLARIFSVVDVYDALISERPYKSAWTPQAAREWLRGAMGTQFDPQVVTTFLALLEQDAALGAPPGPADPLPPS
ncbi:HD domain-containing phosphohydrolase [Deinococcus multiflagellatus]|uniref:HD domain-containing phosphohydrolase n=1 Tax=Deinococcus multiflagellatus TaxID=1656887 RepID=A0ABW1ZNG7_9DEIO|nr:HD domain-containing phosphohydrolase [Deinococcus multiflagellatus]MBZ9714707.1 GAF domain-containing protein [Deinococcus multiflagellatus]